MKSDNTFPDKQHYLMRLKRQWQLIPTFNGAQPHPPINQVCKYDNDSAREYFIHQIATPQTVLKVETQW